MYTREGFYVVELVSVTKLSEILLLPSHDFLEKSSRLSLGRFLFVFNVSQQTLIDALVILKLLHEIHELFFIAMLSLQVVRKYSVIFILEKSGLKLF